MKRFQDRNDAGKALAARLAALDLDAPVVLALPRGGVPVAAPVARRLGAPLDVILVRKIGMPGQPELAAGAVVDGAPPVTVFNDWLLASRGLERGDFDAAVAEQLGVIAARRAAWGVGRAPVPVAGCEVIVVDDGIATGATVKAALKALAARGPAGVTLAVPVAPPEAEAQFAPLVDRFVALLTPEPFLAVGQAYEDFAQTGDDEVMALLRA